MEYRVHICEINLTKKNSRNKVGGIMLKEKEMFYKMMSNYFTKKKKNTVDYSENKSFLEKIAIANKCLPFFCECSKYVNIEPAEEIKNLTLQIVAHNFRNLSVQNKIIRYLTENNILCAVLKGASVAVNYPEPILRPFGDIDLLVSEKDYERTIDLLLGERERNKISSMHKFHYQLRIDGISVEIHNAVAHFADNELDAKKHMISAIKKCSIKNIDCFKFPVLSEIFQAPALLLHTKTHYFENELTFRLLCDWAMFVYKISDEYWNEKIYPTLKNIGLNKWADSLNQVCKRYLNMPFENKIHTLFKNNTIENLANEIISDALNDDNEKKKSSPIKNSITLINDIAIRDFSLVGAKKCLSPLFWPFILIRYLYRCKIGIRRKINILEYANDYNIKEKIYREIQGAN